MVEIISAWGPRCLTMGRFHRQWAQTLSENLAPHSLPGAYFNILGPDNTRKSHTLTLVAPSGQFSEAPRNATSRTVGDKYVA
jgi:hypothetical protein